VNKRRFLAFIVCVFLVDSALARDDDKVGKVGNVIDFLKSYPVSKIEPGVAERKFPRHNLPEIPLEKWLGSVMGDTPLEWKAGDCAAHDSDLDGCVLFSVHVSTPKGHCPSVRLWFGIERDASVGLIYNGSAVNAFGASGSLEQLADLERILREARAGPVRPSSLTIDRLRARKGTDIALYARGLDVHRLDPSLPSERFDKWVERIADWQFRWSTTVISHHCSSNKLDVYVLPIAVEGKLSPPFSIVVHLGSWEEEIKGEPKLTLAFYEKYTGPSQRYETINLSTLKNKIDAWKVAPKTIMALPPNPVVPAYIPTGPAYKPKVPVVQNMVPLGVFSRTRSTPTWHCYGHVLSLWRYGERVFGTHYDIGGQCADSQEPTYVIRDVKFVPKTGNLEFLSYGVPGHKFVGKMDQDMVTGEFLGSYGEKELRLKRNKDHGGPLLDSDKNVEAWCKDYAPKIRRVVEGELEELCKSMGVK
jgi:hypothetical protein